MEKRAVILGSDSRNRYIKEILLSQDWDAHWIQGQLDPTAIDVLSSCTAAILPANYLGGSQIEGIADPADEVLASVNPGAAIFAGRFSPRQKAWMVDAKTEYFELLEDPCFTLANAHYTAEAAVALAITTMSRSLIGATVVVIGSGRIAKALVAYLEPFTKIVRVVARRPEELERANLLGYSPYEMDEMGWALYGADCVFNTVPSRVILKRHTHEVSKGCLYLELASAPYGSQPEDWPEHVVYLLAGGLPGKISPRSAGGAAAEYILGKMEEME